MSGNDIRMSEERAKPGPRGLIVLLITTCHPLPTIAVTAFVLALGAVIDLPAGRLLLVGIATLAGQLSIGWSNDLIDASRDARSGRADKPLRNGAGRRVVVTATALALGACVLLSLVVGLVAAACHLVGVACGWAYNVGLKATVWSWAPYALAFGLLPSWVFAAQPGEPLAPAWMMLAAALLGVAAHLANAAPDIADDTAHGVRGLPQRLGAHGSITLACSLLGAAALVGILGPQGDPPPVAWAALGGVLAASAAVAFALLSPPGRSAAGDTAVGRPQGTDADLPRWCFPVMLLLVAVVITVVLLAA